MENLPNHNPTNPKEIDENKLIAAFGYIIFLVPLLLKRDNAFCQFHGKQGLVIFIVWLILWACNIVPILGQIVFSFGSVVLIIMAIFGIIKSLNGEEWEMPVLGKYAKQIKL